MTDKQLIRFAAQFRKGILNGGSSRFMCAAVCWPLVSLLRVNGIAADAVESDLGDCIHVWIRLRDGRVLDPTADQFEGLNMPPVYLGAPTALHPEPRT